MCVCDHVSPTLYESRVVKTRKPHRCCECDLEIPTGSQAQKTDGLWDGDFSTVYTCLKCQKIWDYIFENPELECLCLVHGEMYDAIHFMLDEGKIIPLQKLPDNRFELVEV
jgi:hypothetical protein